MENGFGENVLEYNKVRDQIKDGDIFLYIGKGFLKSGFVATLVQKVTRSAYSHAGIAAWWGGRLIVMEAVGNGVIVNPLSLSLERYQARVEWYSCKDEIPEPTRQAMMDYAKGELGKPFAVLLAFWFMIKILFIGKFSQEDRFKREKRYYCSEFVSNVYDSIHFDLKKGRSSRYMSPDDIAHSDLLVLKGVVQR